LNLNSKPGGSVPAAGISLIISIYTRIGIPGNHQGKQGPQIIYSDFEGDPGPEEALNGAFSYFCWILPDIEFSRRRIIPKFEL